jgi:phosphopantothenoylcysteine decarboxylase
MAKVLLGVTGSVAAIRAPGLHQTLVSAGHQTRIVATSAATYFFDPATIDPVRHNGRPARNPQSVVLDQDEWPGAEAGDRFRMGDDVLHIELRRWADVLLIAPLDANTLAKMVSGLADNCLTCVWRAWDVSRPVILAPAMNTMMWEHPLTVRQLHSLAEIGSDGGGVPRLPLADLVDWINANCPTMHIVPPQIKRLACGDVGLGALADVDVIVEAVDRTVGKTQAAN